MTEKEYRSNPAISRSDLWKLKSTSPEKFKYEMDNPSKPTQALAFGQLFHTMVLEPEKLYDEYVATSYGRKTKKFAEIQENNPDKTVVTDEEVALATKMRESVFNNKKARNLLKGEHEKEFFWRDDFTGVDCKCRTDVFKPRSDGKTCYIADLKSAADASPEQFMRDAYKRGYHFQAAYYGEGVKKVTGLKPIFMFLVVEKEPPYAVAIYRATEDFVLAGQDNERFLLSLYKHCKENDDWFGYNGVKDEVLDLDVPYWASENV